MDQHRHREATEVRWTHVSFGISLTLRGHDSSQWMGSQWNVHASTHQSVGASCRRPIVSTHNIIGALKRCYRDHQLDAADWSQLQNRRASWASSCYENSQWPSSIHQSAHWTLVGLPEDFIQRERLCICQWGEGPGRETAPLHGQSLNKSLIHALKPGAAKAAAEPPASLWEVSKGWKAPYRNGHQLLSAAGMEYPYAGNVGASGIKARLQQRHDDCLRGSPLGLEKQTKTQSKCPHHQNHPTVSHWTC
jgi:hypothetical protein